MLTIICGEDIVASRDYYNSLKSEHREKGMEITTVAAKDIEENITKSDQTYNLFGAKLVYFTQNLNAYLSRLVARGVPENFESLFKSKDIEIIDWEEGKPSRDIKIAKLGKVQELKLPKSIFNLLDLLVPSKRKEFVTLLKNITETQDEMFIFTMISRHVRTLILAKERLFSPKTLPWQRGKLSTQARVWSKENLLGFYEGLHRIDIALKTGGTPFTITKSLDILACHYL